MDARTAKSEDTDILLLQQQSDLGLRCLSRLSRLATRVRNFRIFTVTVYASMLSCHRRSSIHAIKHMFNGTGMYSQGTSILWLRHKKFNF